MNEPTHTLIAPLRLLAAGLCLAASSGAALAAPAAAYQITFMSDAGQAVAINEVGQVVINTYGPNQRQSAIWTNGQVTPLASPGYDLVMARGINDQGVVVGEAWVLDPWARRPVRWDEGVISDLPHVVWGSAMGINNAGVITGRSNDEAVKWKDGAIVVLPSVQGAYSSVGNAINDQEDVGGDIVHQWSNGAEWYQEPHFEYEPGVAIWAGTAGSPTVLAPYGPPGLHGGLAINNSGVVAGHGWLGDTDYVRPVVFKDGVMIPLDPNWGVAHGINDNEDVVGYGTLSMAEESAAAMLWSDGGHIDLNSFLSQSQRDAGWKLGVAADINNKGWIVGTAYNSQTYLTTGFLMTPVPEPLVPLMALAGLMVVALARQRPTEQGTRRP